MIGRLVFNNEFLNFLRDTNFCDVSHLLLEKYRYKIDNEIGNFIKVCDKNPNSISFLPLKFYKKSKLFHHELLDQDKGRISIKIGRFINKLDCKEFNNSNIEIFVNIFKSYFTNDINKLFIVDGEDIKKWYLENNYSTITSGNLWHSCMRQKERNNLMQLYSDNKEKVKMLILLDENKKLRSRSLLWYDIEDINGNKYNVMDRVYSIFDHDYFLFKDWADKNRFITKWEQNSKNEIDFNIDGKKNTLNLKINLTSFSYEFYPYLDTFKFFNKEDGILYNYKDNKHKYVLTRTNGELQEDININIEDIEVDLEPLEDYNTEW